MQEKSIDIWSNLARVQTNDQLMNSMFANWSEHGDSYHTELRLLNNEEKYNILDFGCGLGRNAEYLNQYADRLDGYDLPDVIKRANGKYYNNLLNSLDDIELIARNFGNYDIVVVEFVFQFFFDVEYFRQILERLSKISGYIYVVSRVWAEGGWNVFEELMTNKANWNLVIGDGQDIPFLMSQGNGSLTHFEAVFKSQYVESDKKPHIGYDDVDKGLWVYKSYNDAFKDLREWANVLPKLGGVCGVPRSGVTLASYLSHYLNVPLFSLEGLSHNLNYRPNQCRPIYNNEGPILILDDTIWSGQAMHNVKNYIPKYLRPHVLFGALYANQAKTKNIDVYGKILPTVQHTFEWNLLRDPLTSKYMVDLDGVLCENWLGTCDDDELKPDYIRHLKHAKPLFKPLFPIYKIVTARLEKWRFLTQAWLNANDIQYGQLIMSPYKTIEDRTANNGFGHWKAEVYKNDDYAACFIESEHWQAEYIHSVTGKPTFCVDTMKPYGNVEF